MAKEQTLDEILERIRRLPPKDAATVAVRAAMRVLPLLADSNITSELTPGLWQRFFGKNHIAGNKQQKQETFKISILNAFRACQCAHAVMYYTSESLITAEAARLAARKARLSAGAVIESARYAAASAYLTNSSLVHGIASNEAESKTDPAEYKYLRSKRQSVYDRIYAEVASELTDNSRSIQSIKSAFYAASDYNIEYIILDAVAQDLAFLDQNSSLANEPLWITWVPMPEVITHQWENQKLLMRKLDPGFEYWIDWYEARLRGEPLVWDEIKSQILLTEEQLGQDPQAINAYLLKLAHAKSDIFSVKSGVLKCVGGNFELDEFRPLNRVRAILIGPGFAGKTSLLRALHGKPVVEGKEDMTVGIEISESSFDSRTNYYQKDTAIPNEPIVHFWDFGGQVMYHATHQFFLRSNCVYVLVLDGRRAAAGGSEADYWLEHVRAFAPDAPVLIVGNKADLGPMDWDQNRLRKKYPNIRPHGFYQLACTELAKPDNRHRHDFARFKEDLREALQQVGMVQQKFTPEEFAVLDELRRRSPLETFLPKETYEKLCVEQGLRPAESLDPAAVLLDLLDKLGVVIHFPNLPRLDEFLLNPRWLTYGVYQIIDRKQPRVSETEAFDCLSRAEVADNLGNRLAYPRNRCGFILDAMEQFKVAYRLAPAQGGPRFEIPSLLPTDEPDLDFPESEARAFRFRFEGLLPPQLLPQLIVARHADIDQGKVWRHGAMLKTRHNGGARALLRGDAYDRILTLWVIGPGLDRYFAVLYQNVKDILATMPELPCEELIRLPLSARLDGELGLFGAGEPWARWVNVLHAALDGEPHYREEGVKYDLKAVLGIMAEADRRNLTAGLKRESRAFHLHYHSEVKKMGDSIHISGGQQGAVGSHAKAEGNVFVQNPAVEGLSGLLAQLLEELRGAERMNPGQREDAIYEVETACEALQDLQAKDPARKAKAEGRLRRILGGIKNNVGPVADGIAVLKEIQAAGLGYGPALLAAVEAVLKLMQ